MAVPPLQRPFLHATRNDLGENTRLASANLLNATLVDLIDLTNAVRMAHWTVRGLQFAALHELFGEFYEQLGGQVDDVAERIIQLGGTPDGTTQLIGQKTRLAPYDPSLRAGTDHLAALVERYAAVAASTRGAVDEAAEVGDADTADLLTGTSRLLDKALWMLEAHLD